VPVIKEGDMIMPDSDKIVVYLEDKFPEPSMKSKSPDGT
jgi:glutathione S-transferase